jgi:hypothetical protein
MHTGQAAKNCADVGGDIFPKRKFACANIDAIVFAVVPSDMVKRGASDEAGHAVPTVTGVATDPPLSARSMGAGDSLES